MDGGGRHGGLDGLRGIAALSIVVLHCWLYTTTTDEKHDSLWDGAIHQFRLGVVLFFCLSGYLLYRGWVAAAAGDRPEPALAAYARSRTVRILPAYLLALAGTLAILGPQAGAVRGLDVPGPEHWWLFLVFGSNLSRATAGALDPPMWTLAVEVQFYLLLPLLGLAAVRLGRAGRFGALVPAVLAIAVGVAFDAWAMGRPGDVVILDSLPVALPAFGCGMLVAVLLHRRPVGRAAGWAALLAGAALVVADGWWHETGSGTAGLLWRDLPACAGFALLVAAILGGRARWLAARPLVGLGAVSFGLYLWHMPVILALRGAGIFPEGEPLLSTLAVLAVSLPLAWASWRLVEQPLLERAAAPRAFAACTGSARPG